MLNAPQRVGREMPANPNVAVYHSVDRLTDEVVESYRADDGSLGGAASNPRRAWVSTVLEDPRVRDISINAYRVRVAKRKDAVWTGLVEALDAVFTEVLGGAVHEVVPEDRYRSLAWAGPAFDPKRVHEGARLAAQDAVAGPLFDVPGVAEAVLDGAQIHIRRAPLHGWADIVPALERRIAAAHAKGGA